MKAKTISILLIITFFIMAHYLIALASNKKQSLEYIISLTENNMLLATASDGSHHLSINSPGLSLVSISFDMSNMDLFVYDDQKSLMIFDVDSFDRIENTDNNYYKDKMWPSISLDGNNCSFIEVERIEDFHNNYYLNITDKKRTTLIRKKINDDYSEEFFIMGYGWTEKPNIMYLRCPDGVMIFSIINGKCIERRILAEKINMDSSSNVAWSANGNKMFFNSRGNRGPYDKYLLVMDLKTNSISRISNGLHYFCSYYDGTKIAFQSGIAEKREIEIMDINGKSIRKIYGGRPLYWLSNKE